MTNVSEHFTHPAEGRSVGRDDEVREANNGREQAAQFSGQWRDHGADGAGSRLLN